LGVAGTWLEGNKACVIINVYSLCQLPRKRQLWENLINFKQNIGGELWCVTRDFNTIRKVQERRRPNNSVSDNLDDIDKFNDFICQMELLDIPFMRRKYTWYCPNGQAKSRLDRFLLSI